MYESLNPVTSVPARDVRAGDTILYRDAFTGRSARAEVLGLSFGFVWVGGARVDTVCLAVDPVTGRGPVMGTTDAVNVVRAAVRPEPHPGEKSWW